MEVKKSAKANLEDKKLLLREIGLVVALLVVLGAFQWSSKEKSTETVSYTHLTLPTTPGV